MPKGFCQLLCIFIPSAGGWLTTVSYLLVEQWYNYNSGEVVRLVRSDTLGRKDM